MNMAQYSSGVGPPIPPTQSINENAQLVNNSADWNGGPLASPYPTAQHINNLTDSNAAPQAVYAKQQTGYRLRDLARRPEAFHSIYPASHPPPGMAFTPMQTPTPDRRGLPAQHLQGFTPQFDPQFISAISCRIWNP
jgi:hypothetical protein